MSVPEKFSVPENNWPVNAFWAASENGMPASMVPVEVSSTQFLALMLLPVASVDAATSAWVMAAIWLMKDWPLSPRAISQP